MKFEKTSTSISGLDEMLSGGIPKGSNLLVAGSPGSGKSIFAMQFLYSGVMEQKEPGIYVSLDKRPNAVYKNFSTFNWELDNVEILSIVPYKHQARDEVRYVVPPEINKPWSLSKDFISDDVFSAKRFSADFLRRLLCKEIKRTNAKRIAIDTITPLVLNSNGDFEARQDISAINNMLNELGCTSIMTIDVLDEHPSTTNLGIEAAVMDGVVMLYNVKRDNIREMGLEVLKMNGTKHTKKTCAMEITDQGMVVHPKKNLFN